MKAERSKKLKKKPEKQTPLLLSKKENESEESEKLREKILRIAAKANIRKPGMSKVKKLFRVERLVRIYNDI